MRRRLVRRRHREPSQHDRAKDVSAGRPQLGGHRRPRPRRGQALLRRTVRLDVHRRHSRRRARQLPDRHPRRRGRRRDRIAGLRRRGRSRGAPTSPSTTPTPPPRPSRRRVAPSPSPRSTPGRAGGWPSASIRAAPSSGCGRRASGSVPNSSTRRGHGTSATCTRLIRTRPRRSTHRCSAGRSTTSGSRPWSAGRATATTSPRPSTPTSGSGNPMSARRPGSRTPSRWMGIIPEGHPELWQVTFAVADRDASAATAERPRRHHRRRPRTPSGRRPRRSATRRARSSCSASSPRPRPSAQLSRKPRHGD